MGADSRMLLTACDDMHAHLYDVEHASLIEAFSGTSQQLSAFFSAAASYPDRQIAACPDSWHSCPQCKAGALGGHVGTVPIAGSNTESCPCMSRCLSGSGRSHKSWVLSVACHFGGLRVEGVCGFCRA